jgi:hypothetical protein
LRTDALRLIQEAAGDVWTDFNEHDPGVTTLELLCYGLTELSYRATLPVADILTGADGRIDTGRQALQIPRRILPGAPVTINDYRKLLIDRVPGLGNVWLLPVHARGAVNGLYDVLLYAPDANACRCEGDPPDPLIAQALGVYARHRGLCEDVRRITLLRPARTTVTATATVDGRAESEAIVAELLYRAGLYLAPEIRRKPLTELVQAGIATSQIFEGPLLRNGFIDDSQLAAKPESIDCTHLVSAMASTPGVLSVNDVRIRVGRRIYDVTDTIEVPQGEILQLDQEMTSATLPIRLLRHGTPCRPDPNRVRQELEKRWRNHRRIHPLARDYNQAFPVPHGRHRDLAQYASVRTLYPELYGVGPKGLPADAPPLRRAQAKQLKGYLLVFEQLLADYLAQLAHARDLLSADPTADRGQREHPPAATVPDAAELMIESDEIDAPRAGNDQWTDRRNRTLDLLLALYAADVPSTPGGHTESAAQSETLIEMKLELLRTLTRTTRQCGHGFDYLAETSSRNASGLEISSRIQLGKAQTNRLHVVEHVLLRSARNLYGMSIAFGQFDYAFTVSAVLHVPEADAGRRREIAAVLRANTPAHIAVLPRFLDAERIQFFEALYAGWCAALRSRSPRAIVLSSVQLRDFLADCPPEPELSDRSSGGVSL